MESPDLSPIEDFWDVVERDTHIIRWVADKFAATV